MEMQQEREKLISTIEFERNCRQQDLDVHTAEVNDLQEQLGEYEEETMKLNNHLYQAKLEITRLQKIADAHSPTKSVMSSKISRAPEQPSPAASRSPAAGTKQASVAKS